MRGDAGAGAGAGRQGILRADRWEFVVNVYQPDVRVDLLRLGPYGDENQHKLFPWASRYDFVIRRNGLAVLTVHAAEKVTISRDAMRSLEEKLNR